MHRIISTVVFVTCVFACACESRAQCDSTPPQIFPAFTLYGPAPDAAFGQNMYVIHDTTGHAHLIISASGGGYYLRDYSRYAGQSDTSYRCCLQYTEAHECHVTGSHYADYVVHWFQAGFQDSIFLIPGSPEGIWSLARQLLMTPAANAVITTGDFWGSGRDGIVIGNEDVGKRGSVSIWRGGDILTTKPDTVILGDSVDLATMYFGKAIGSSTLSGAGIHDLVVRSGSGNYHEINIFWGGSDFPARRTRWRDRHDEDGWQFEDNLLKFADVTRDSISDLLLNVYMQRDTVWGVVHSADRIFCYNGGPIFDTVPYMIWRPLDDAHDTVCLAGIAGFGATVVNLGDINGTHRNAIGVGAPDSYGFNSNGALLIYLGGNDFDTLPDGYFVGIIRSFAGQAVGGFDWNNDSLMDFAVPMSHDDAGDHPAGEVAIFSGSRSFRSFGITTLVKQSSYPTENYLRIFPQPVRDKAEIRIQLGPSMDNQTRVIVYDMFGRTILSEHKLGLDGAIIINLGDQPAGVFLAVLRDKLKSYSQSFIHLR